MFVPMVLHYVNFSWIAQPQDIPVTPRRPVQSAAALSAHWEKIRSIGCTRVETTPSMGESTPRNISSLPLSCQPF